MPRALHDLLARAHRIPPLGLLLRLAGTVSRDDLPGMAAKMAYYFMLSLFPGLILLIAVLDALPLEETVQRLSEDISRALPGPAAELILNYLKEFSQRRPSGLVSLWGLAALWAASRGMADARKSMNVVFAVQERRSIMRLRLVSLVMTLACIVLLSIAYLVLVGGPELGEGLAHVALVGEAVALLFRFGRWPLVLLFLTGFVILAYRYLPYRRVPFRYLLAGAVPVVGGWVGLGLGFRLYLKHAGNFDQLYGSLASVILLMVFLWAFSLLLLFGAEVAANVAGLRHGPLEAPPRSTAKAAAGRKDPGT